jgi:hypothetical protein
MNEETFEKLRDMAKHAVERNDESIRFSETKSGIILAFVGLLLGFTLDDIQDLICIIQGGDCFLSILAIISLVLVLLGVILIGLSSFLNIYPRLRVSKDESFAYFGSIKELEEDIFISRFQELSPEMIIRHMLSQAHATSIIAWRKFQLVRVSIVGAGIVFIGWLIAAWLLIM